MLKLFSRAGVTWDTLNMCAYGMQDPVSGLYYQKAVTLLHNFPSGAIDPIFVRCPNLEKGFEEHQHQKIEKSAPGHGDRAALSQIYPMKFCRRLSKLIDTFLHNRSRPSASPCHNSLLCDLLDLADLTLSETKQLADWSELDIIDECCLSRVSDLGSLQLQVKPVPVYDEKCKLLMNRINALPKGSERYLHYGETKSDQNLAKLARNMRSHYLPMQNFNYCLALRGTLGENLSAYSVSDNACVVMWKKADKIKQVSVAMLSSLLSSNSSFDPRAWEPTGLLG